MIPKKIHFIWFSEAPFPRQVEECIASWHLVFKDYEVVNWTLKDVEKIRSPFLHEAIKAKKWAFAADYLRIYALYHFGGIYIDSDVMMYRPVDDLLSDRAFIGRESSVHIDNAGPRTYLGAHFMGCEPKNDFLMYCLDYYEGRHFVTSSNPDLPEQLKYDERILPEILAGLAVRFGYNPSPRGKHNVLQHCGSLTVYPSDYFDPNTPTKNTRCRHLALGAWRAAKRWEPKYNIAYKVEWRVMKVLAAILRKFNYLLIKIN